MSKIDEIRNSKIIRWIVYAFIGVIVLLFIKSLISLYDDFETSSTQDKMREYSKRLERKNLTADIYYNNLDSLLKLGQYQNAIKISELRIKTYPEDKAYITRSIGYIYYCKGDFDSAILKYTEAINLTNSYVGAYADRGLVYMELDSLDLAIEDLEFAASVNYDYYLNLGLAQEKNGQLQNAIDSYNKYLKNNPENINWKYRRDSLTAVINKKLK